MSSECSGDLGSRSTSGQFISSDSHDESARDERDMSVSEMGTSEEEEEEEGDVKETSGSGSSQYSANISSYAESDRGQYEDDNGSCDASEVRASISSLDEEEGDDSTYVDDQERSTCSIGEGSVTAASSTVDELPQRRQHVALSLPASKSKPGYREQNTFLTEAPLKEHSAHARRGPTSELIVAIENGDVATVKQLVRAGTDLQVCDRSRRTPLHVACGLGHFELVRILIKAGCNIDACSENGRTPLHEASIGGHYRVIQLLLSEVSDLDHTDKMGMSAAHLCSLHGEVDCLNLLCNQGCDICLEDHASRSAVHLAAMNDHPDIIHCLMERGVELDTVDKDGKTPAHYAAQRGSIRCLQELIKNNIDMCQGDSVGCQPAHDAARLDQLECLKFMLKTEVKVSAQDSRGRTLIHKAALGGALSCLHWMLSTGKLSPNTADDEGCTALHYAAAAGHAECYHCLLQHGADPSIVNTRRENAFDMSRKQGKPQTISKAIDGSRPCKYCHLEETRRRMGDMAIPSSIRHRITSKGALFTKLTPLTTTRPPGVSSTAHKQSRTSSHKKNHVMMEERSLAAKYYGPWC